MCNNSNIDLIPSLDDKKEDTPYMQELSISEQIKINSGIIIVNIYF